MIKKFRLYIMLAAVMLSATSCLDKLPEDEVPFDQAIQTVDDVNLAVIGIYDAYKSKYLYSGNLTLLPDLQTDLSLWNKRQYEYLRRYLALERHPGYQYRY